MNEYSVVAYVNEEIRRTDKTYNNQYPYLFPDIYDRQTITANKMDEPPSELTYELISKVEDEYMDSWKVNNEIPKLSIVEDYIISRISEDIERLCDEEFKNDPRYWEDEDFKGNQLKIREDDYWSSGEGMNLDELLRQVLDYLGLTYIDDLWDNEVVNLAQRRLFEKGEVVGVWSY